MSYSVLLPPPRIDGAERFERVLAGRRTRRSFKSKALSVEQLSQLLWAAEGITEAEHGYRTTPSGGAIYPLVLYVLVGGGGVETLGAGLYRHKVEKHALQRTLDGELRLEVDKTMFNHHWVAEAPVNIIIAARYSAMTDKYGGLGTRYADMETGHMAENIMLQAEALGLGAGLVVAFAGDKLSALLGLPKGEEPIYCLPVGYAD